MDREFKRSFFEIIVLTVMLIIVVPICVEASSEYKKQRNILVNGTGTSVDITNNGDMKKVTIYSRYDDKIRVNLFLRINNISDNYNIYLDGQVYDINDFMFIEEGGYKYYQLGIFEVYKYRDFDFKLITNDNTYYDETLIYSFVTEGLL